MTARLMVREVGAREFLTHTPDFEDEISVPMTEGRLAKGTALLQAEAEGLRLCVEGNVEAFQVWTLHCAKQRTYAIEDIPDEAK